MATVQELVQAYFDHPQWRAYLESIGNVEGANQYGTQGGYDISFNGQRFDSYDSHPAIRTALANGKYTTAAGKFQITKGTYDWIAPMLGITDFSPDSQERISTALAAIKKDSNGVSALEHIVNGNYEQATSLLQSTWAALPQAGNNRVSYEAFYNDLNNNLARITDGDFTPATFNQRGFNTESSAYATPIPGSGVAPTLTADALQEQILKSMATPKLNVASGPIFDAPFQSLYQAPNAPGINPIESSLVTMSPAVFPTEPVADSPAVAAERKRQRLDSIKQQLDAISNDSPLTLFGSPYPHELDNYILGALDKITIPEGSL